MSEQVGTLQPVENTESVPAKLDVARRALAEATDDWERIDIRDFAKAIEAASAILDRKEIQIQSANLVQDAERAIAKANPPRQGERTDKKDFVPPEDEVLKPIEIRKIRQAHVNLTDTEYEQAIAESAEKQIPLTRSALQEKSKQKRRAETRQERIESLSATATELPMGEQKFSVVYADPPWRYDFAETANREIENQYPTMSINEIKDMDIGSICHSEAVLYLWSPAPKLLESLSVMEAWGFEYKTHMVWVKDRMGMGYWARSQHEHLLIGTRGEFPPPAEEQRVSSVIEAPRGKHSEKPVPFAELLETLYPDMAKIELFCRTPREDWSTWGNEVATTV